MLHAFMLYDWPGNVRELKNAIEYACIFAESSEITPKDLPSYITRTAPADSAGCTAGPAPSSASLKTLMEQYEANLLSRRMAACGNRSRLARELGITRQTLLNKLSKYGLL